MVNLVANRNHDVLQNSFQLRTVTMMLVKADKIQSFC